MVGLATCGQNENSIQINLKFNQNWIKFNLQAGYSSGSGLVGNKWLQWRLPISLHKCKVSLPDDHFNEDDDKEEENGDDADDAYEEDDGDW